MDRDSTGPSNNRTTPKATAQPRPRFPPTKWRTAEASTTRRRQRPITVARREAVQFQHVAPRKIADVRTAAAIHRTTAAAPAQPSADEAAPEARAPLLDTDDSIDRAYADERTAIMQDFARRIAGARDPGERRAIKTARKSALAAAKQKAKLLNPSSFFGFT